MPKAGNKDVASNVSTRETASTEHILHFAQQSPHHRLIVHFRRSLQFLKQLFLALAQLGRNLHAHFHVQITLAATIQHRHSLVADAERGTGLRSIRNLERVLAFQSGHANLRAHRGLRHGQRDGAVQIIPFPHKKWMLLHMQHHVEIARGASEGSSFAASGKADSRSVLHPGRNLRVHLALPQKPTLAFALRAGISNYTARSLAGRTGPSDAEETLLIPHLTPAGARTAGGSTFARRGSRTSAIVAGFVTAHHDALFHTKGGLFKLNGQVLAQIRAALNPAAAAPTASERIPETEKLAEDVAEILEHRGIETRARTCRTAHSGMAVAVVERSLFGVGQYRVGLGDFLKAFFRIGIVGGP